MLKTPAAIIYPEKFSEAEIQSLLWFSLRKLNIDARLEVRCRLNGSLHRLDLVVFKNNQPHCIVECKAYRHQYSKERLNSLADTKQLTKYRNWGLPVYTCAYEYVISSLTEQIKRSLKNKSIYYNLYYNI